MPRELQHVMKRLQKTVSALVAEEVLRGLCSVPVTHLTTWLLRVVDLTGTAVTEKGVADLRRARPNIKLPIS